MKTTVGIAAISSYIPPQILTSKTIANTANIPSFVLTEKIGMKQKHIAQPHQHPSQMGYQAAQSAIKKANINPTDIDIIVYCAAGKYDYQFWSPAAKIQNLLNAKKAFAFEISNFCNSGNLGIHICRNFLLTDPNLNYALIICSDTLSRLVNPTNNTSPSLLTFADGAAAVILKKGETNNTILGYHAITDGTLADEIKIPLGGTKFPINSNSNNPEQYITVPDNQRLEKILSHPYLENYKKVIHQSLIKSNLTTTDIDFLFTNQVKKSLLQKILNSFQLKENNTIISLTEYGHMGAVDTIFCLEKAIETKKIKSQNVVILASSATGFSWAALTLLFN